MRFMMEIVVAITLIRSSLYDEDRGEIYSIILKLIKSILKLLGKYKKKKKKNYGNNMTTDVAQCERSNIKCYASTFSNI